MNFFYSCSECGIKYAIRPDLMLCPDCSIRQEKDRPLRGVLDVDFSISEPEIWFHRLLGIGSLDVFSLLPVEKHYLPDFPVGDTPLWQPEQLRKKTGFHNLYLKDDTCNPTGSLKDRASYLVAGFAKKYQINNIVAASTGNAGSSMAGVCAATGMKLKLFLPKKAPKAKLVQSMQYGADIEEVDGNYDKAYDLSLEYSKNHMGEVLNRNTAYNPLTIEGKKTVALEIVKQLGHAPDYVFVPTGDGVILSGVYKGFRDLLRLKLLTKMPIVYAVQAAGSNALYRATIEDDFMTISHSRTIADSIAVDIPRNGYHALKNLKTYGGKCITVTDEEILKAQTELASHSGLFAEPSSAAALAGLHKAKIDIPAHSIVVLLITGNGLKDVQAAM